MLFDYLEFERVQKLHTIGVSYDKELSPTYHVTDKVWDYIQQLSLPWIETENDNVSPLAEAGKRWAAKHGHKEKYKKR